MKLKEKFEQYAKQEVWEKKNYNAEECEFIAEDFAIGFAEWFWINKNKFYKGERDYYLEFKELLEIYKIEKGL